MTTSKRNSKEESKIAFVFDDDEEDGDLKYLTHNEGIDKMAKSILKDIDDLSDILEDISKKQREDFLNVFRSFMESVKKELRNKLDRIVQMFNMKLNLDTNQKLQGELTTFRNHAIRLNSFCSKLKGQVNDLTSKMSMMTLEMTGITMKWKNSEAVNQKLLSEFEKEIKHYKELEDELIIVREELKKETEEKILNKNLREQADERKEGYQMLIDKLKNDIKREQKKTHKYECELNKMLVERNKLENIFIDCVEETRKNVMMRRIRENIKNNKNSKMTLFKSNSTKMLKSNFDNLVGDVDINTKYDTFSPEDKKKILEKFLFNDEVSKVLRNCLFVNPQKEQKLIETKNQLLKQINKKNGKDFYVTNSLFSNNKTNELHLFLGKGSQINKTNLYFPKINDRNLLMSSMTSNYFK